MSKLFTPVEAIAIMLLVGAMAMQSGREPEDALAGIFYVFSGILVGMRCSEEGHL